MSGNVESAFFKTHNRPRSIYQYSNMTPRLSGQTSIFGVVFFVSKSLSGIEGQRKFEKFAILTRKPRSHARILIYRTWPIHKTLSDVTCPSPSLYSTPMDCRDRSRITSFLRSFKVELLVEKDAILKNKAKKTLETKLRLSG